MSANHTTTAAEPGPNHSAVTNGTRTFLLPGGEQTAVVTHACGAWQPRKSRTHPSRVGHVPVASALAAHESKHVCASALKPQPSPHEPACGLETLNEQVPLAGWNGLDDHAPAWRDRAWSFHRKAAGRGYGRKAEIDA